MAECSKGNSGRHIQNCDSLNTKLNCMEEIFYDKFWKENLINIDVTFKSIKCNNNTKTNVYKR